MTANALTSTLPRRSATATVRQPAPRATIARNAPARAVIPRSGPPIRDAGDRGGQEGADTVGQAPSQREHDLCSDLRAAWGRGRPHNGLRGGCPAWALPGGERRDGVIGSATAPDGGSGRWLARASDPSPPALLRIGWSGVGETTAPLGGASGRSIDGSGAARAPPAADRPQTTTSVSDCAAPAGRRIHVDLGSIPLPTVLSWRFHDTTTRAMCQSHTAQSRDGAAARNRATAPSVFALASLCWPLRTGVPAASARRPLEVLRALPGHLDRTACSGLIDGLPGRVQIQRERVRIDAVGLVDVARPRWGAMRERARSRIRSRRRPWSTSTLFDGYSCAARPTANAPCWLEFDCPATWIGLLPHPHRE